MRIQVTIIFVTIYYYISDPDPEDEQNPGFGRYPDPQNIGLMQKLSGLQLKKCQNFKSADYCKKFCGFSAPCITVIRFCVALKLAVEKGCPISFVKKLWSIRPFLYVAFNHNEIGGGGGGAHLTMCV